MYKTYFGEPGVQIHARIWGEGDAPLILLPPSPYSSLYFETVGPLLARDRKVIALDYPGFGGSDPLDEPPTITAYAQALKPVLDQFETYSLLGFHTGNLVAIELALLKTEPELMILVDVPYFDADLRADLDTKMGQAFALPDTLSDMVSGFNMYYAKRRGEVGQARAFDFWVEALRSGAGMNAAFHAAFTYDCDRRFPMMARPVTVIATQSMLLEPSRQAAALLPHATLVERLDIDRAVFEMFAEEMAGVIHSLT